MSGPRAPLCRGVAVLRRKGQHTRKINMATRLVVAEASQERDQGGREEEDGCEAHIGAAM
jgi:hypothetical protein